MPPNLTSPAWTVRTKRTIALITIGLLFLLSLELLKAWSVVIIATVLSYLLNPLVNSLEEHLLQFVPYRSLRRTLAVLITFVIVIFLLALFVILIVPPIAVQMQEFADNFPRLVTSTEDKLEAILNRPINFGDRKIVLWDELNRFTSSEESSIGSFDAANALSQAATALSTPVVNAATIAFGFVFDFLFVIVMMFYLLKDGASLVNRLEDYIPENYRGDIDRLTYELRQVWNAYLRGQLLLGVTVGVGTGIGATILGLPQPLVLGLLAGLLEFIPNIGPILSSLPAILFALISESTTIPGLNGALFALLVVIMYTIIQQGESLFLVPRIMGRNLELHPFYILVAVLSGAAVAGLLGIILAAPVVATMRLLLTYIWGKLFDIDPFAGYEEMPLTMQPQPIEPALPSAIPPALQEPFAPAQKGEIVSE